MLSAGRDNKFNKMTIPKIDYTNYGPKKVAVVPVSGKKIKIPYGAVECVLKSISLINSPEDSKQLLDDIIEICCEEKDKINNPLVLVK
jgi:hypothetical protein